MSLANNKTFAKVWQTFIFVLKHNSVLKMVFVKEILLLNRKAKN